MWDSLFDTSELSVNVNGSTGTIARNPVTGGIGVAIDTDPVALAKQNENLAVSNTIGNLTSYVPIFLVIFLFLFAIKSLRK